MGGVLQPPYGTIPAAVKINTFWLETSHGSIQVEIYLNPDSPDKVFSCTGQLHKMHVFHCNVEARKFYGFLLILFSLNLINFTCDSFITSYFQSIIFCKVTDIKTLIFCICSIPFEVG